jgi:hypothetical protein
LSRVYRLEVVLVCGLLLAMGGMIWAVIRVSGGTGPPSETNSTVIKELLDGFKTLLGALITWGTIIVNGFAAKDKK